MNNYFKDNDRLEKILHHPLMHSIVDMMEDGYTQSEKYAIAPDSFEDAIDSYYNSMEILGGICASEIAGNAKGVDLEGPKCIDGCVKYASGTEQDHKILIESGLYGLSLPREYNGLNFPTVLFSMSSELISRADASFDNIWSLQDCAKTIEEFGSDEQKSYFLPKIEKGATCSMDLTEPDAGSDLQAVQLKASFDEEKQTWVLNGVKRFITNGDSDIHLIVARSEENTLDARGLSLFVYEKQSGGMTVRRIEHKLGIIGSPTCELVFKDAPVQLVGNRRMGLIKYVMAMMNGARLGIGAQSVGIAEAAYRASLDYGVERKQYGQFISEFPAVAEMLAVMRTKIDASRELLYETSRQVDLSHCYSVQSGKRNLTPEERSAMKEAAKKADLYTPILKLLSGEFCNEICYDAIQILGGCGYTKDFPVERYYRDARVLTIYEGTSQMQVVAVMKYVNDNALLNILREHETKTASIEGYSSEKELLRSLTDIYQTMKQKCAEMDTTTFHARRIVETGSYLIISYILMENINDERSRMSFIHFLKMAEALTAHHEKYICTDSRALYPIIMNVSEPLAHNSSLT